MGEKQKIRVLILEDVPSDAELVKYFLEEGGFRCEFQVVDTGPSYNKALNEFNPELIVSDFNLPTFTGFKALKMMQEKGLDIPFIFVTGTLGEENAVEAIKLGATDFIIKQRVENLPVAVMRAFREHRERQQRKEQQARFKALIEYGHDPVMLFGEDSVVTYTSPAVERVLGYKAEEFVGLSVPDIIHPDDREKRSEQFQRLLDREVERVSIRQRFLTKHGKERWVHAVIHDQRHIEGVRCFSSNFRDIHEQVLADQKIQEQQKLLDRANRLALLGNWNLDMATNTLYWSEITKEIHEVPSDFEPQLETALAFYEEGESRDLITHCVNNALEKGEPYDVELKIITAKGNRKWVRAIGESDFVDGKCIRMFGSFQDIEAQKQTEFQLIENERQIHEKEEFLRNIFDNTLAGLIVVDDMGNYVKANQGAANLLGYPVEELIGMNASQIQTPESQITAMESYNDYLKKGKATGEFDVIQPSGNVKTMLYQAVRVREDFNISFMVDITERKQAQMELRKSQEKMKQVTDLMPGAIFRFRVSPDGGQQLDYISEGIKNLSGFEASEYDGAFEDVVQKLMYSEDIPAFANAVRRSIENMTPFRQEFRSFHQDGTLMWTAAQSTPSIDETDGSIVFHGVLTDVTKEKEMAIDLQNLADQLKERVKEQRLLYRVSRMLQDTERSIASVLQDVADAIPEGMSHPDCTVAEVIYGKASYRSDNVPDTEWKLEKAFRSATGGSGSISVYCSETPPDGDWPFTPEEEQLLETLSDIVQSWLGKVHAQKELQTTLENLEQLVKDRTAELEETNEELTIVHKEVTDSINHAKRIQNAILPPLSELKEVVKDAFIFYQPKDVVSGDFYWYKQYEGRLYLACVDCTGHGVPGALMSMIGNELLEHTIVDRKITRPDIVLEEMDRAIVRLLRKSDEDRNLPDGMDIALCVVDPTSSTITYSGAHSSAFIMNEKGITELPADRYSIGGAHANGNKEFGRRAAEYRPNDRLYMFSDGYHDQFGGPNGKKFMRKRLLELLQKIHGLAMEEQFAQLTMTFDDWKGDHFQVDDVTVIGVAL